MVTLPTWAMDPHNVLHAFAIVRIPWYQLTACPPRLVAGSPRHGVVKWSSERRESWSQLDAEFR